MISTTKTARTRWERWSRQEPQNELVAYLRSYWKGVKDGTETYPNRFLDRLVEDAANHRRFTPNEVSAGLRTMERRLGAQRAAMAKRRKETENGELPAREPAAEGLYRVGNEIYVVRIARQSKRPYARRLVETPPRLTQSGDTVHWDFKGQAPGMVFRLTEDQRITDEDELASIAIKTGKCARCGHAIWRDKSVRRMYGTRCWKRLTGRI